MIIGNTSNKTSIYGLYNVMYEGNMSLNSIKMNKSYFASSNDVFSASVLGGDALGYITSIKSASKDIVGVLNELSGAAFAKKGSISTGDEETDATGGTTAYAKASVEKLVKSYNDLYVEAVKRSNDPKAQNLAVKMINISKTYSGSLSKIGIGFDSDGKMTLDSAKLNEAAESGKLEQFFTENSGKNYGFTNQLSRLAENVSRNTANYVSKSEFLSNLTENFAYSSYGDLIQYKFFSAGLIFDYSF